MGATACVSSAVSSGRGELLVEALSGPQRGERRRRRLEARARGRVLRERVAPQVQRRLEATAARGARHWLRLVDEAHVLAQVGRVAVPPAAHRALHAAARAAGARARARARRQPARCQQHHVRTKRSGRTAPPSRRAATPIALPYPNITVFKCCRDSSDRYLAKFKNNSEELTCLMLINGGNDVSMLDFENPCHLHILDLRCYYV